MWRIEQTIAQITFSIDEDQGQSVRRRLKEGF
jgi:hypothetical protein